MTSPDDHTYRQCQLRHGDTVCVTWLPARFAVPGKTLRLRDSLGEWQDGWVVETCSEQTTDDPRPREHEWYRAYKQGTAPPVDEDWWPGVWI